MEAPGINTRRRVIVLVIVALVAALFVIGAISRVSLTSRTALDLDGGELVRLEKAGYENDHEAITRLLLYYRASAVHLESEERLHRLKYWEKRLALIEASKPVETPAPR